LYFKLDDPIVKAAHNLTDSQIELEILKKLRMNGLVLNDKEIIKHMDNSIDGDSLYIPASIKKNGEVSSKTSGANEEEFKLLRQYTKRLLKSICKEIADGKISISPCKQNNNIACEYCEFLSVCQFDRDKDKARVLSDISEEKLWDKIREVVDNT